MKESEAKQFIEREVATSIRRRLLKLTAILGVVNFIALVSLVVAVKSWSEAAAKTEATKAALLAVKSEEAILQAIVTAAQQRVGKLDDEFLKIGQQIGSNQLKAEQIVSYLGKFEGQTKTIEQVIGDLTQKIENATKTDKGAALNLLTAIGQNTNAYTFITRLDELGRILTNATCSFKWGTIENLHQNQPKPDGKTKATFVAPSSGFVIVSNGGSGYGNDEVELVNTVTGSRIQYTKALEARFQGSSFLLPANKGDKIEFSRSASTATMSFVPIEAHLNLK